MARNNRNKKTTKSIYLGGPADEGHLMTNVGDNVTFAANNKRDAEDYTLVSRVTFGQMSEDIAWWGMRNQLPQEREALIMDNNIVGELLGTKRDIILGDGLYTYKMEWIEGKEVEVPVPMPDEIKEFLDASDIDVFMECNAGELVKHGNMFTEFVARTDRQGIARMYSKACKYIRAGMQNSRGHVTSYWYHGSWLNSRGGTQNGQVRNIMTHNFKMPDPMRIPAFQSEARTIQLRSMHHTGDKLFFDGYYYHPRYWGGKKWIKTSNPIPVFHQHNMENGYNIRWHIEMPVDYFLDTDKFVNATNEKEKQECIDAATSAEKAFMDKMNKFLAGVENSGRAIFTKLRYTQDKISEWYPGVKITPLSADLKDEAMLKLYDKSNDANISASGLPTSLSGIATPGKLGNGSDIRNSLLLFLATKVPTCRRNLLEPLKIVQKVNGWDKDIKFGFKDKLITKLDDNPTGMESAQPAVTKEE